MFQPISPSNLEGFTGEADARVKLLDALGAELGSYGDGVDTLPGIWVVVDADVDPPRHFTRSGLECLVFAPEVLGTVPLCHNAIAIEVWRIRLIQHDRKASTLAGYLAILAAFPDCHQDSWFAADRDINEQMNLSISFSYFVRT
jgi:hypothetical protein